MERVCAWCGKMLEKARGGGACEVSHGICESCMNRFWYEDVERLDEFLDTLCAPVLMVDAEGVVISANGEAREVLGKELPAIRGRKGGDVMRCAYAFLPEGCGDTVHCDSCTIRNTVMATHEDGKPRVGVEAYQELQGPEGVTRMRIFITTERFGRTVLLRIDEMAPAPV